MISYEPLKKLMKERGVAVKDLAAEKIFIADVLAGRKSILTDKLDKLCKYFNCNVSDLISYERDGESQKEKIRLKIDWALLKSELEKHNMTFYTISLKLNKNSSFYASKAYWNQSITLDELLFIAKEINCNPEEFLID